MSGSKPPVNTGLPHLGNLLPGIGSTLLGNRRDYLYLPIVAVPIQPNLRRSRQHHLQRYILVAEIGKLECPARTRNEQIYAPNAGMYRRAECGRINNQPRQGALQRTVGVPSRALVRRTGTQGRRGFLLFGQQFCRPKFQFPPAGANVGVPVGKSRR